MRRRRPEPDEDDDWDDEDLPEGVYRDDGGTEVCPNCGAEVYEGSPYCPRCETYISQEDSPPDRKPTWVWVCLILSLGMAVLWVVGG